MAGKRLKNGSPESAGIMRYTVLKVRLYPTEEQAEQMEKTFGCCRYLWNRMLADVEEFYAATDLQYIPTPARYKAEAPFLKEVDSQALCSVHQNLRQAFLDFFRAPKSFAPPRFKAKKARRDSFTVYSRPYRTGPSIYITGNGLQMPKLGVIRAKLHRKPLRRWSLRSVTVSRTRTGKYFASIAFGYPAEEPERIAPTAERTLGLNYAPGALYVDSEGGRCALPAGMQRTREKLARAQQALSRMERGSKHYEERLRKLRLLHERLANQRLDFVHKESRRIANDWDAVCVRDAGLADLSQKLQGVRVMDAGFGRFRECLQYKLEQQGKTYVSVNRYAPVAKTCRECGGIHETLSPREKAWTCPHCGAVVSRELNTARNIRDMGLAQEENKLRKAGAG